MTDETQDDGYIRERYRGAPLSIEKSIVDAMAAQGLDAMQQLRNKVDEVMDTTRTFSEALYEIKAGQRMRRQAWPAQRFVYLVLGSQFAVNRPPLNHLLEDGTIVNYQAHIDVFDEENKVAVWHATNADILADDWHIFG